VCVYVCVCVYWHLQVYAQGNSCLHLTDDQADALGKWRRGDGVVHGGGYECDSKFLQVEFLNNAATLDLAALSFGSHFKAYTDWLADANFEDTVEGEGGCSFRDPPLSLCT